MKDENSVLLTGRLTKDPELAYLTNQTAIVKFNLANNYDENKAYFLNCVGFDKLAEFTNHHFKKGDPVYIRGVVKQRSWEDATSGKIHSQLFIQVQQIRLLGRYKELKQEETPEFGE